MIIRRTFQKCSFPQIISQLHCLSNDAISYLFQIAKSRADFKRHFLPIMQHCWGQNVVLSPGHIDGQFTCSFQIQIP